MGHHINYTAFWGPLLSLIKTILRSFLRLWGGYKVNHSED